jgi:hypothetical protein
VWEQQFIVIDIVGRRGAHVVVNGDRHEHWHWHWDQRKRLYRDHRVGRHGVGAGVDQVKGRTDRRL